MLVASGCSGKPASVKISRISYGDTVFRWAEHEDSPRGDAARWSVERALNRVWSFSGYRRSAERKTPEPEVDRRMRTDLDRKTHRSVGKQKSSLHPLESASARKT